ncbi:SGNH family hydrolase [Microvirga sp. CF3062]|uniref:SGNH/GDSL hydrolase family protein n=1 Tax=Microvirga sp. CF3062 TaxID=3110182 RepID=UPI002E7A697E|nr:SGNH family hydrolase [Microvirga sp. CF3062]MEE1657497.1 SGNH family hydrolase [Microvirga sp. CF3062]
MPILRRMTLALLLVAGGVDAALAQSGSYQQPGYRDQRAYPPGYYPGKLVQPAQPQPQQGFSIRRFFGARDEPPPPARAPVSRPRRSAPPPAAVAKQEKPKVNPSTHVVVFGDALASYARQGLDAHFSDDQDVAVVSKVRSDTNLVRSDPADWPNFIKATLDGGQKTSIAVVMLGTNDRQSIRDVDESVEPLSDRWKELYRQRIDAITVALKERKAPFIWIGLPPMKNSKLSDDLVAMNEIYKESVQRSGGVYVDIWPGFVDEENRYTDIGPDVDGDPTKLRTNEGIFFTRAGARKVAFFADTEIKRVLGLGGTATAAAPDPAQIAPADGSATPAIEASVPPPPDAAVPVALPQKPLVGPVLPLTRQDVAPGGTLVSAPPKLTGDNAYTIQRALRTGVAPNSRPGRADDFRWPPS